jgi:hypothetical protein
MMDLQIGAPSPPSAGHGGEVRAGVIEEARRRQRRHRRVGAALIGTAGLAAALLAGFGGGLGGGPGPGRVAGGRPNGPVPVAWRDAGSRAFLLVAGHDHACAWAAKERRGPVRVLDQAPPKALTSVLAVLSKPAPSGSRVAPDVLRASLEQFPAEAQGIYIRYARRGHAAGLAYYLIPAAHLGIGRVPARCYLQEAAAFKAQIAHLPAVARRSALRWERQQISIDEAGGPPGVELVTEGPGVDGGRNYTVDELRTNPYGGGGGGGNDTVTETALVVPNNVASVTARYSPQKAPGRVAHPVAVTRPAVNNLVIFVYRGAWDPPALTYRSSSGAPLSTAPRQ